MHRLIAFKPIGPVMRAGVAMLDLPKYVDPTAHLKYPDIESGEWRKRTK